MFFKTLSLPILCLATTTTDVVAVQSMLVVGLKAKEAKLKAHERETKHLINQRNDVWMDVRTGEEFEPTGCVRSDKEPDAFLKVFDNWDSFSNDCKEYVENEYEKALARGVIRDKDDIRFEVLEQLSFDIWMAQKHTTPAEMLDKLYKAKYEEKFNELNPARPQSKLTKVEKKKEKKSKKKEAKASFKSQKAGKDTKVEEIILDDASGSVAHVDFAVDMKIHDLIKDHVQVEFQQLMSYYRMMYQQARKTRRAQLDQLFNIFSPGHLNPVGQNSRLSQATRMQQSINDVKNSEPQSLADLEEAGWLTGIHTKPAKKRVDEKNQQKKTTKGEVTTNKEEVERRKVEKEKTELWQQFQESVSRSKFEEMYAMWKKTQKSSGALSLITFEEFCNTYGFSDSDSDFESESVSEGQKTEMVDENISSADQQTEDIVEETQELQDVEEQFVEEQQEKGMQGQVVQEEPIEKDDVFVSEVQSDAISKSAEAFEIQQEQVVEKEDEQKPDNSVAPTNDSNVRKSPTVMFGSFTGYGEDGTLVSPKEQKPDAKSLSDSGKKQSQPLTIQTGQFLSALPAHPAKSPIQFGSLSPEVMQNMFEHQEPVVVQEQKKKQDEPKKQPWSAIAAAPPSQPTTPSPATSSPSPTTRSSAVSLGSVAGVVLPKPLPKSEIFINVDGGNCEENPWKTVGAAKKSPSAASKKTKGQIENTTPNRFVIPSDKKPAAQSVQKASPKPVASPAKTASAKAWGEFVSKERPKQIDTDRTVPESVQVVPPERRPSLKPIQHTEHQTESLELETKLSQDADAPTSHDEQNPVDEETEQKQEIVAPTPTSKSPDANDRRSPFPWADQCESDEDFEPMDFNEDIVWGDEDTSNDAVSTRTPSNDVRVGWCAKKHQNTYNGM